MDIQEVINVIDNTVPIRNEAREIPGLFLFCFFML